MQTSKIQSKPTTVTGALRNQPSLIRCPRCQSVDLNSAVIRYANIQCNDCGFTETRLAMASKSDNPSKNILEGLVALGLVALGAYALASILDALND